VVAELQPGFAVHVADTDIGAEVHMRAERFAPPAVAVLVGTHDGVTLTKHKGQAMLTVEGGEAAEFAVGFRADGLSRAVLRAHAETALLAEADVRDAAIGEF